MLVPWKKSYDKPRQCIKNQRHHVVDKGLYSESCGFSSSHVWMQELDHKDSVQKNWCFWNVVLEKTLENSLDSKEIKPTNPKGNKPWIFIRRTDAEAEAPILWPHDAKSQLIRKDPDAGKDWGQKEKGVTEDEMVGWHHWLSGHGFEQTPGDIEGQRRTAVHGVAKSRAWLSDWTTSDQIIVDCDRRLGFGGSLLAAKSACSFQNPCAMTALNSKNLSSQKDTMYIFNG